MAHTAVREEKAQRTVKHFVLAGRQLENAQQRFLQQQRCLGKRVKREAQIALDQFLALYKPSGKVTITEINVPLRTQHEALHVDVVVTATAPDGADTSTLLTDGVLTTLRSVLQKRLQMIAPFQVAVSSKK